MPAKTVRRRPSEREESGAPAGESGVMNPVWEALERLVGSGAMSLSDEGYTLSLNAVTLRDRLLLLGPPGVGKSETIFRLSRERARREGRIFVDVRCLMKREGCRIPLKELEGLPVEVVEWLRANKKIKSEDGKEYAVVTYSDVVAQPERFYLYLRLSAPHVFPEDLQYPKPWGGEESGAVEFLLPKALYLFTLPGVKGTLFLDEITNVQRDDQMAMYYTLVLDKELGYTGKISDDVYIVAAGNPPEWSSVARGLPAALLDRFLVVNVKPPTVAEWVKYMNERFGNNWNKLVGVFLLRNERFFLGKPETEETLTKFPTPRSWTQLALLKDPEEIVKYAPAIVGPEAANAFLSFLKTPTPSLEELNRNPRKFREPTA